MIVILILIIAGLAGFCMISADELVNKRDLTWHAWIIVIFIFAAIVGCLFIYEDTVRTESIKSFTKGEYCLEEITHSDTTYLVKKVKK